MPETTNLQYETRDGVALARITAPTVSERESQGLLHDLTAVAQGHAGRIVLDLSQVLMVTSAGLGMLIDLRKVCTAAGPKGKVVLCHACADVRRLLDITKLHKLFPLATGMDAALEAFK